ncbi:L-prolyl-AMP ligase [Planctomycetaceae bacterium]|nr:L-prolyl-AMP ligase [Planctomycetaceae bacterium]
MSGNALLVALAEHARSSPDAVFLVEMDGRTTTYGALASLATRIAETLREFGVRPGDRVGVHLRKSVDAVAAICGILHAEGIYVPLDAAAPAARSASILVDCGARAVLTGGPSGEVLRQELAALDAAMQVHLLTGVGGGAGIQEWLVQSGVPVTGTQGGHPTSPDSAACILYTSGSTGGPKGVVIPVRAVESFVQWAIASFAPNPCDRVASHAPFHFDLSIFDLFVPMRAGASVLLLDDSVVANPRLLVECIASRGITIWYSTPTTLRMLLDHGRLEETPSGALRLVLFAGEVFPLPQLRRLTRAWPAPRYCNLYGPTETNVVTWFEVPPDFDFDREPSLPIGEPCAGVIVMVEADCGGMAGAGEVGELLICSPTTMTGYWNRPDLTARALQKDSQERLWYKTGDLASRDERGVLHFHGRRDRMIKRRGYRIELAEIEAALSHHPQLGAVVTSTRVDSRGQTVIVAHVTLRGAERPSVVDLKKYCSAHLPLWMIPDQFEVLHSFPMTSTGKVDLQSLGTRDPGS